MALAARHKLAEHENPGEATLLVLSGLVELATSTARATLAAESMWSFRKSVTNLQRSRIPWYC